MKRIGPDRVGVALGVRVYPGTRLSTYLQAQEMEQEFADPDTPRFYTDPQVAGSASGLIDRIIAGDRRFLFYDPTRPDRDYNYNANEVLLKAIEDGYRGAYWDILRRVVENTRKGRGRGTDDCSRFFRIPSAVPSGVGLASICWAAQARRRASGFLDAVEIDGPADRGAQVGKNNPEEINMDSRLQQFRKMGWKAAAFTMSKQQPDGGYVWEGYPKDAYHKQPYSWGVSGYYAPAHRLLNWVGKNALQPESGLMDYNGDLYKQSWFFQGAHRMGRFDLSYPIMEFLLSCQKPCGGFPHFAKDAVCRAMATAWTGISALYFGRINVAEKVAEWCIRLLDQPATERFYIQTTNEGRLLTDSTDPKGAFIDFEKPRQAYWELSLPWMLMGRMYMATGRKEFLDYAGAFFEIHLRFYKDRFSWVGSGKSSLAAAIHYLNTGDARARDGVLTFLNFLLDTQTPEGGWRDETERDIPLIHIDHAAEFNVWIQEDVNILEAMQ